MIGTDESGHNLPSLDFRALDFDRLWRGRENVTAVERQVVRQALASADVRRILEVGPGNGRLSPALYGPDREYLGLDVTLEFLGHLTGSGEGVARWVAGDVNQLPLIDGSVTVAVIVRVLDFLSHPEQALKELSRVLTPGGTLVLSYYASPSLATVVEKLVHPADAGLRIGPVHRASTQGRLRGVEPKELRSALGNLGFDHFSTFATGLEDFRPLRWLPPRFYSTLAGILRSAPGIPHRFIVARKGGRSPDLLPTFDAILACPECRSKIEEPHPHPPDFPRCLVCGFRSTEVAGVVDLRPRPRDPLVNTPTILVR